MILSSLHINQLENVLIFDKYLLNCLSKCLMSLKPKTNIIDQLYKNVKKRYTLSLQTLFLYVIYANKQSIKFLTSQFLFKNYILQNTLMT